MRGPHVRPLVVVVALTVLAAIAVIGGALGVRSLAATATMPGAAAPSPPVATAAAGLAPTDLGAAETALSPERADPVGRDLPAAVGRTAALVVLLGAVLLLRRHPAAGGITGSGRPRPPLRGPIARSTLPGITPGLLRV